MITKARAKRRVFAFLIILVAVIAVWIMPFGGPSCSAQAFENPEDFFEYTITDNEATIDGFFYPSLPGDFDGHLFIPETLDGYPVTAIADETFLNWKTDLTEVTIPQSVVSIGGGAFANCENLTKVTFDYDYDQAGLESIGSSAFSQCASLESIVMLMDDDYSIPNSVTSIGQNAFFGCSDLKKISIPSGLTTIEDNTFFGCSSLTRVIESYAGSSLTTIGSDAFSRCNLQFYYIPESVTSIGDAAFYNCSNLFATSIPNGVTAIEPNTFYGCSSLTNLTWSYEDSQVTSIGFGAFIGCSNLSNVFGESSFIIPKSVVSIDKEAFYSCSNISDIIISDNVTSIGDNTFDLHNENLRIHGFEGSYAQTYADDHSIGFVALSPFSPNTVDFDKNPSQQADVTTDKTLASAAQVTDVRNGETSIGAENFSYSGNTLTIKKEYLLLQELGSLELTVVFENGVTGTLTINISDSGPAVISPNIGSFMEGAEGDVLTTITWHGAESVSTVKAGAVPLTYGDDYTVTNDDGTTAALTIKKEYLQTKPEGSLILTIEFNTGDPETLTISIKTNDPVQNPNAGIHPETGFFYLNGPEDVTTTIKWNKASSVADITAGGASIGEDNYAVTDNDGYTATLTIKKEYLEAQAVGSLELSISFNSGNPAMLTIDISENAPIVDAVISPASANYDLSATGDVSTTITWNSASIVTDVVYSSASLNSGTDYTVTGSALTIKDSFLSGLMPSVNDTLVFDISFDIGSPVTLTVHVEESYIPSDDADLSDLTVGGGTISGFDADITSYNVELPYGTVPGSAAALVGATANGPAAQVDITQASALPGSATVKVTAEDGTTTKIYTINLITAPPAFVPVTDITGVPTAATAGVDLTLNGTVAPANATNKTIDWSVQNAGTTGATVSGNMLSTTAAGTVTVRATITNGLTQSSDYTQDFTITVSVVPVTTYTITFNDRGSVYATRTVNEGECIGSDSWPSNPTRTGYTFGGWYTGTNGSGTKFTSAATVNANITVYAKWTADGGGGSGGRRRTPSTPATPEYKADVKAEKGNETTIPVAVFKDTGTAFIDTESFDQDGITVTMPTIPGVENYTIGMPVAYLSTSGGGTLTFNTDTGSLMLPVDMLSGIPGAEGRTAEITIGQGDKSNLPADIKAVIGERPLISLSLTLDGDVISWNNPGAPVTVSIPHTPTIAELADPEHIVIWYIDGSGNAVSVPSGRYEPATGMVTFTTTHFSRFAVVYVTKAFDDLGNTAWAKKQIEVLASKGILIGISETEYAPQTNITRADFLCFLVRTLGVDARIDGSFDDISQDAYYFKEIAIARKLGITSGTGNNKFSPDASITRQDMMVLTERALRMLNRLEAQASVSDLEKFADKSLVAAYAVDSVASVVKEGLIVGGGDNVNPLGNTTRAEAAVFLYRIYSKY